MHFQLPQHSWRDLIIIVKTYLVCQVHWSVAIHSFQLLFAYVHALYMCFQLACYTSTCNRQHFPHCCVLKKHGPQRTAYTHTPTNYKSHAYHYLCTYIHIPASLTTKHSMSPSHTNAQTVLITSTPYHPSVVYSTYRKYRCIVT